MTIETEESVVLRGSLDQRSTLKWCPVCGRRVEMVTPGQAARIADVSTRTVYRWIEAARVHFTEDRGHLLICLPSLPASVGQVEESEK